MNYPNFIQGHKLLQYYWRKPWTRAARHSLKFKRMCWRHGYLSPHFTRASFACTDGSPVPYSLKGNAQRHAFNLERFRHAIGDVPLPTLSEYRTPSYNAQIGGATNSRHMYADATDFSSETINRIGRSKFFRVADVVFANGGVGTYPWGSGHLDSRGYRARWTSF